jgi:transposase-like protein
VRWHVRDALSERAIQVDHVTDYRWVQTVTPKFIDAASQVIDLLLDRSGLS